MKFYLLLLLLTITTTGFTQNFAEVEADFEAAAELSQIEWLTNLEEAQAVSRSTNKPILMYFTGSDWCSPCVALKSDFFESQEFQKYNDAFVMVMIDYPRRLDIVSKEQMTYNKSIIAKYNKSKSFPKILLLDQNLREKDRISGYSSFNTYKDTSHHFAFVEKHVR